MQLEATSRSAHLKVIHVEESDACDSDEGPANITQLLRTRLLHELVKHVPGTGEPVAIWRLDGGSRVRIGRLHDDPRARVVGVRQDNMNVVIVLALHTHNASDHPVDAELLVADPMVRARPAVRRNGVEGNDGRVNRGVQGDVAGVAIAKALDVGPADGAAGSECCTGDDGGNDNGCSARHDRSALTPTNVGRT